MREPYSDSESERAALAQPGRYVVACQQPCRVCGQAMTGRKTSACSDTCRAAKSRRKRGDELALVEDQLNRALTRVRVLRRTQAGA